MGDQDLSLTIANYQKDAVILVEGKLSDCFYIIKTGQVKFIRKASLSGRYDNTVLSAGDFLGVESALSNHFNIEGAKALTNVSLLVIKRDQFSSVISRNPRVAMKIVSDFARQVRFLNEALAYGSENYLNIKKMTDSRLIYSSAKYYVEKMKYPLAYYCYKRFNEVSQDEEKIHKVNLFLTKLEKTIDPVYVNLKGKTLENNLRSYPKGAMIFAEGEKGSEFMVIQKGSVRICRVANGHETTLAILKAGDIVGEMALLDDKARSASAIANEETLLMSCSRSQFKNIVEKESRLTEKITKSLADRIWLTHRQVTNSLISDPLTRLYDGLLTQLEHERVDRYQVGFYRFAISFKDLLRLTSIEPNEALENRFLTDRNVKMLNGFLATEDLVELRKKIDSMLLVNRMRNQHK